MTAPDQLIRSAEAFKTMINQADRAYSEVIVLCDEHTAVHCLPYFEETYLVDLSVSHRNISIPAGEDSKCLAGADRLWTMLIKAEVDRDALLLNLGGGVVSDLGGFVAAGYKRGIRLLNIPTTHLAMTDAAIGGKNGINHAGLKNQIGAMHPAVAVLIDPKFLETLPKKELESGWIETVKHALIADEALWERIQKGASEELMYNAEVIFRSAEIKNHIAATDTEDQGIRQSLNFGHTVGHALEAQQTLLHGEAVAFGIVAEAYLSHKVLGLSEDDLESIIVYLERYRPALSGINLDSDQLLISMRNDKKNRGGRIRFSLIPEIGQAEVGLNVSDELIREALDYAAQKMLT